MSNIDSLDHLEITDNVPDTGRPDGYFTIREASFENGKNITGEIRWVTIRGNHIPIEPGGTIDDALKKLESRSEPVDNTLIKSVTKNQIEKNLERYGNVNPDKIADDVKKSLKIPDNTDPIKWREQVEEKILDTIHEKILEDYTLAHDEIKMFDTGYASIQAKLRMGDKIYSVNGNAFFKIKDLMKREFERDSKKIKITAATKSELQNILNEGKEKFHIDYEGISVYDIIEHNSIPPKRPSLTPAGLRSELEDDEYEQKYTETGNGVFHSLDILNKIPVIEIDEYLQVDEIDYPYTATGSKVDSQPEMTNEAGWSGSRKIPEFSYEPEAIKENIGISNVEKILDELQFMEYVYQGHDGDDICAEFNGKVFDMDDIRHRPVPPSENEGYTNTHPNCLCYWKPSGKKEIGEITERGLAHIQSIHRKIGQRARNHTLHTLKEDGTLSQKTRGTNPMKEAKLIRETITELTHQFNWINPDYIAKVKDLSRHVGGKFVLVRASAETITDHRSEGEPYRRLLKGDELAQLTRTGIGKTTDINHLGMDYKVNSDVIDAEYDPIRKESQMLVHLKDPEIIHYIMNGDIGEVSINAGFPRRMDTDCNSGECFVVPTGMVLGELDGIAFTWVITNPNGVIWNGRHISQAKAGVKTTKIELL